jgi:hypothetical protein
VKGSYPTPDAIAQTIAHPETSLAGAREFYAAAGVVVYANERLGMANLARRTWLAPAATRGLSTYLDMVSPAVGGLLLAPTGVQAAQLNVGGAKTAAGRLRELAEAHLQQAVAPNRMTLCSLDDSPDKHWEWSGVVAYDHLYRLRTGEFVTSRPHATFHVRGDSHRTRAHILVDIHHAADFEHVQRWIARLLPASERWGVVPVALLDGVERHTEVRSIVDAIGVGGEVMAAHPHTQRVSIRDDDAHVVEFVRHMKEARYSTSIQGLNSLIERAERVDHSVLSAFDLYHWCETSGSRVAVRVRLKQHGIDPLTIEWGSARAPGCAPSVPLPKLNSDSWELMSPASWTHEQRKAHLRLLWSRLIAVVQEGASAVAA